MYEYSNHQQAKNDQNNFMLSAAVNYYAKLRRLSGEYTRIVTACYLCAQMKVGTCPACENFTRLHVVITTNAIVRNSQE